MFLKHGNITILRASDERDVEHAQALGVHWTDREGQRMKLVLALSVICLLLLAAQTRMAFVMLKAGRARKADLRMAAITAFLACTWTDRSRTLTCVCKDITHIFVFHCSCLWFMRWYHWLDPGCALACVPAPQSRRCRGYACKCMPTARKDEYWSILQVVHSLRSPATTFMACRKLRRLDHKAQRAVARGAMLQVHVCTRPNSNACASPTT